MRRSITQSVSVSEMLHMRNVLGLSNGEIAEKVGCSAITIRRAIGPHPEGKRRTKRKTEKPLPPPVLETPAKSFRQRCEEVLGVPDFKVDVVETTVKGKAELQKVLDNMALLFGKTAVKAYLRCAGYLAGTQDGMPVLTSEECFAKLRKMEGE